MKSIVGFFKPARRADKGVEDYYGIVRDRRKGGREGQKLLLDYSRPAIKEVEVNYKMLLDRSKIREANFLMRLFKTTYR